jgi:4-amino-4-deoxy-L-arabinose transferase-like glycosyltransferase
VPLIRERATAQERAVTRWALFIFLIGLTTALLWTFIVLPWFAPIARDLDVNGLGGIGVRLANGEGFSLGHGPSVRRAPIYPLLVAGVVWVFGFDPAHPQRSYLPVFILQCLFAALTCVATFFVANRLFGLRAGALAGLMCAVWPQCLRYLGSIEPEALMTLWTALLALAAVRLYQQPDYRNAALLGLITGLYTLTKSISLFFPLAMAAILAVRALRLRQPIAWGPMAASIGVLALVCLPWIVRNHIVSQGRFHNISSNAPGEFLRGYVNAQPKYSLLRREFRGNWDVEANLYEDALLRQQGYYFDMFRVSHVDNEILKDRVGMQIIREKLSKDPLGFAQKFLIQCFTFWYLVETPSKSILVGALALVAWLLAGAGIVRARREGVDVAPIMATVLYFNVVYAVFLAFARYSMPVFPALLVLSAQGLSVTLTTLLRRRAEA